MRPAFEAAKQRCGSHPATGVEVGVAYGRNAKDVLDNWKEISLVLVDNYSEEPSHKDEMTKLLWFYAPEFICNDSVKAASLVSGRTFDIVYLDGDHTYEGVKADLEAWLPLVKKGGVFGGDDYMNTTCPGVNRAVNEFVVKHGFYLNVAPNGGAVDWFVYVEA